MAWQWLSPWSLYQVAPKKRKNWHFSIFQQIAMHSEVKQPKKEKGGKPWLNFHKHWEWEYTCKLQLVSGSTTHKTQLPQYQFVQHIASFYKEQVQAVVISGWQELRCFESETFRIIWKLLENCQKICTRYDNERLVTAAVQLSQSMFPSMSWSIKNQNKVQNERFNEIMS